MKCGLKPGILDGTVLQIILKFTQRVDEQLAFKVEIRSTAKKPVYPPTNSVQLVVFSGACSTWDLLFCMQLYILPVGSTVLDSLRLQVVIHLDLICFMRRNIPSPHHSLIKMLLSEIKHGKEMQGITVQTQQICQVH